MNRVLLNVYGFLFGVVLAAAVLFPFSAHAYIVQTPTFSYFTPGAAAAQGALKSGYAVYDGVSGKYLGNGGISVNGRALTVPGKFAPLSNIGQLAKAGMRANPWLLAGSLALPWLLEHGMEWDAGRGEWVVPDPSENSGYSNCYGGYGPGGVSFDQAYSYQANQCIALGGAGSVFSLKANSGTVSHPHWNGRCAWGSGGIVSDPYSFVDCSAGAPLPKVAATDTDWNNLPDPMPTVGPELPTADYMPEGAPVYAPTFDFAPFDAPVGEPYKKPDGSTWQPMATVSPNVTNVTINNYDQQITNIDGSPVPPDTAPKTETPPPSDECLDHPERVGCASLGQLDPYTLPTTTHVMAFTPEASPISGSCPAPIGLPNGGSLSFDSACDAMTQIKPVVLALAGILTGIMVVGSLRNGG